MTEAEVILLLNTVLEKRHKAKDYLSDACDFVEEALKQDEQTAVKLIAIDGTLYVSPELILVAVYEAGDCDTIKWPNPNPKTLRIALYGAREIGYIPNVPVVEMPDGTMFSIEGDP